MTKVVGIQVISIARHIWLFRNNLVFESRRCPAIFILERALILVAKLIEMTSRLLGTWNSYPTCSNVTSFYLLEILSFNVSQGQLR